MRSRSRTLAAALTLGLAAVGAGAGTASAAPAHHAAPKAAARYAPGGHESAAQTDAFFRAVMKKAEQKHAAHPDQAVTITYDDSGAPSFRSTIAQAAQIWDGAVSNVQIQRASSGYADFSYTEGNDPRGSYASTDGHGNGYIFLDYQQNQQYSSLRVVAHETGHVLGLPDDYSGPCSELMSGGGPGPSCTNPNPNAQEVATVNQLWAYGYVPSHMKAAYPQRSTAAAH